MHMWKKGCLGLALLASLTPSSPGQIPLTPPSAGGATPLAAPPAAQPTTLWDMLGVSKIQREACKEYLCKTKIGQLMNNGMAPVGALTGGILGPCCPPFNKEDLAKPADSAEGAAARIKQDEAAAKARRAAVRYLGTVDCHYWPEAGDALIGSLRTDRNECVRWEAAMALGSGCCCGKATMKALAITVSGSDEDGNPSETSERVRNAAARSLAHCLASHSAVVQPLPIEPAPLEKLEPTPTGPKPEGPKPEGTSSAPSPTDYYKQVRKMNMQDVLKDARQAQAQAQYENKVQTAAAQSQAGPPRDRTLFGILRASFSDTPPAKPAPTAPPAPTAEPPATLKGPGASAARPGTPVAQAPMPSEPLALIPTVTPAACQLPPIPVSPAGFATATAPPAGIATAVAPPAAPAMPTPVLSPQQLVSLLQTSAYPDQREWAAHALGNFDGTSNPLSLQAVLGAARQDPAPLVRAACVRSLARMNVNTWPVLSTVQALKGDADPRVQHEADAALNKLVPGLADAGSRPANPPH